MASLLIVRRGGDIIGHCDALCYDAKHDECVCKACGGVNHGVGIERAIVNTRALHAGWLEQARAEDPGIEFELDESVQHLPLFPLPEEP
ncbi:hypothetical protein BJF79_03300 [Actinomadura sp. CNU-125]|uniref:hypothetical protein n=1 Tax=Actinomadura sp. CNU-125 TaxID=1904961 RepID=UPI0009625199|nr:hypothetical protein [Actinomadura sp. CNU-125]OLT12939.1 hypothetical protein BJF79_03300 [Actinomadura sp. CNU-125]